MAVAKVFNHADAAVAATVACSGCIAVAAASAPPFPAIVPFPRFFRLLAILRRCMLLRGDWVRRLAAYTKNPMTAQEKVAKRKVIGS